MAVHTFRTVMGAIYEFAHEDSFRSGGTSSAEYTWDGEKIPVQSTSAHLCLSTLTEILEADITDELHLGDGRLLLGHYETYDHDLDISLGRTTVAAWTHNDVAIWFEAGIRSIAWAADLMSALEPAVTDRMAWVTNARPEDVYVRDEELLVTVFPPDNNLSPVKAIRLYPSRAWSDPTSTGHRTQAGDLFVQSTGPDRPRQLLLRTPSTTLAISEEFFGAQGAVNFMEKIIRVDRVSPEGSNHGRDYTL